LLLCSDGIHDNLDPEHLGMSPADVACPYDSWEELEKADGGLLEKERLKLVILKQVIGGLTSPYQIATRLTSRQIPFFCD